MVFYRKYRPQTISELDLNAVREQLTSILSSNELPHAFLFTGSKGLGKTSSARILAKAINCQNKKGVEPCNTCEVCVSITDGSNIDVLEIDAASNGQVDEVRTLRERVKFASSNLRKKVYIIDEVHMMSSGAFNALLKTLEEPPDHVIFILATTELHKLPSTVVSRTFQVQFEKPTQNELIASLERIVKGEKLSVEKGVLEEVYKLSEGSFRDAAKILEELSFDSKGEKITKDLVESHYKTNSVSDMVTVYLEALQKKDTKEAISIISNLSDNGYDFKMVIEHMVEHLRSILMMRTGIKSEGKDIHFSLSDIEILLGLINEAYSELKYSVIPQLPLELVTIKWCELSEERVITEHKKEEIEIKKETMVIKKEIKNTPQSELLVKLINAVNMESKQGGALLKSCKDAKIVDDSIVVTTPFSMHAEKLKSEKILQAIEKAADVLVGKKVKLVVKVLPN